MPNSQLPCGASYDDLLTQVADRAPARRVEHQRFCIHCRATIAELEALWAPVHDLAGEDVRAPSGLLSSVMARVRELPRHTWHAVIPTDRGDTRIAARVVAVVTRLAAEEVASVTLALGGGRTTRAASPAEVAGSGSEAATEVGVAGTRVVVDVHVAVEMGTNIPAVAERLRDHITRSIADYLNLTVSEVNVNIADVVQTQT